MKDTRYTIELPTTVEGIYYVVHVCEEYYMYEVEGSTSFYKDIPFIIDRMINRCVKYGFILNP